jgi:hypothetical protein
MTTLRLSAIEHAQRYLARLGRAVLGDSDPGQSVRPPSGPAFRNFPGTPWSLEDDYASRLEGWTLAQRRGLFQIVGLDDGPEEDPRRKLLVDSKALSCVALGACSASDRHLRALRLHERFTRDSAESDLAIIQELINRQFPSNVCARGRVVLRAQRAHWLIDQIADFLQREKRALEHHDNITSYVFGHIHRLRHNQSDHETFIDNPRGDSLYREALLSTLTALFAFLLYPKTIHCLLTGSGTGQWCRFMLGVSATIADLTAICGLFAITAMPPRLRFASAKAALAEAYRASTCSFRNPATITHNGEVVATVRAARSSIDFL